MLINKYVSRVSLLTILLLVISTVGIYTRWPRLLLASPQDIPHHLVTVQKSYLFNTLDHPTGLGIAALGNRQYLYIADTGNHVIRVLNPVSGTLLIVAGIQDSPGYVNGNQSVAKFNNPTGMMVTGTVGQKFCQPRGGVFPTDVNTIYVNDAQNYVTRKIVNVYDYVCSPTPLTTVSTEVGSGVQGWGDGAGASARFSLLGGITDVGGGVCYMADAGNHCIRMWDGSNVSTFAGNGSAGFANGYRTSAQFNVPGKVTKDTAGNLYVADIGNNAIREIDTAGNVTTCAGIGPTQPGLVDGQGASACFYRPSSVVYNSADSMLYVADSHNNCIRRIDGSGNVTTYAGTADGGYVDGSLSQARFSTPTDLVIYSNFMYVSDTNNNCIRRIDMTSGQVSTYIN